MTEAQPGREPRRFECCICADRAGTPSDPYVELRLARTFGPACQWVGAHERCLRQALPRLTLGSVEVPERTCPECGDDAGRTGNLSVVIKAHRGDGDGAFYIHEACLAGHLLGNATIEI